MDDQNDSLTCKRCKLIYPEEMDSGFDVCQDCYEIIIEDIKNEWWEGQEELVKEDMVKQVVEQL